MSIREEFELAKREYKLAVQQEQNAEGEFIDVAIMNTNASTKRLQAIVMKAKIMGYSGGSLIDGIESTRKPTYN